MVATVSNLGAGTGVTMGDVATSLRVARIRMDTNTIYVNLHCKRNGRETSLSEIFAKATSHDLVLLQACNSTMTSGSLTHKGPSSELISRIHHLQYLLEHLPNTLPLNPEESNYHFGLDMDAVDDEGVWYAFNRSLEVCFEIHKLSNGETIVFHERGNRYKALITMMKTTVKALPTKEHTFPRSMA
jgi:hypothetical protein